MLVSHATRKFPPRQAIAVPAVVLLGVLVAMIALGPVTPASTVVSSPLCLVGLVAADGDDVPVSSDEADGDESLLLQLLQQVQQIQEEEDFHTREVAALGQPAGAPLARAHGRLVAPGEDMSPLLSRPPRCA